MKDNVFPGKARTGTTVLKAVIFDMDGVISDTQQINSELESLLLREYGIEMSAEVMVRDYSGIPEREFAEFVFKKHGKKVDLDVFVEEKLRRLTEACRGRILPIEGALELIRKLKESNFKLAIASSSRLDFIDMVLSELEVKAAFDIITNGQEVKLSKPNPDIFLLTAKKLDFPPEDCVVIEDAKHGVIAAKKAGMKCIWLTNQASSGGGEYSADLTVKTLRELKISDFLS